jgi:addiction module RelE/StbE family toxin
MVKIEYEGDYFNDLRELLKKENIGSLIQSKILLFRKNPDDTRLANHALKKKMKGKWAFSITRDIRIVYKWIGKTSVRFLAIGPHGKVYSS